MAGIAKRIQWQWNAPQITTMVPADALAATVFSAVITATGLI
jgi:hypothetical protein